MTTATITVEEQVAELVKARQELADLRAKLRDPVALAAYL
jgi:ribosomal protein L29